MATREERENVGGLRGILCIAALTLVAVLVAAAPAQGAAPTAHARIGNNTEGATLVTAGPFAEQVALLDGYDVLAVPVEGRGRTAPRKLFDLKDLVTMFP